MEHSDDCNCRECTKEYQEWVRLNICEVCDDELDEFGICERCAEREM